jgi:hypothetical protein
MLVSMSGELHTGDAVADLILQGRAATVEEAEELYLDEHLHEVITLVDSDMTDADFRRHPLIALLLSLGSRGWEDSLR